MHLLNLLHRFDDSLRFVAPEVECLYKWFDIAWLALGECLN